LRACPRAAENLLSAALLSGDAAFPFEKSIQKKQTVFCLLFLYEMKREKYENEMS